MNMERLLYSVVFNTLEFIFFFSNYWWWRLQWLLSMRSRKISGYEIYKEEIKKYKNMKESNFSYGETTALSTKLILEEIKPKPGSLIYDLGSGRGAFLLSSYFLFGTRGIGVEIFKPYVDLSSSLSRSMKTPGVIFRQEDASGTDLEDADIIYFSGATFQEDIVEKIRKNMKKAKPGAIIIMVRNELPEDDFELQKEGNYPFTWGTDFVRFYRKK